ncbi:MAG: WXG100 family type VII secretion target [Pseudonocardiaceae bacterium]
MVQPLPPDTGDSIDVDLEAMRRDAQTWRVTADRMGDAAAAARQLQLNGHALSHFAEMTGLTDAYRDVQQWAAGLLEGAHNNLGSMADALTDTAATYRDDDATGAGNFNGLTPGGK